MDAPRFVPALGNHWLTPAYDLIVRLTTRERIFKRALIRQAGFLPGQRVLDVGCGTGTLAVWIKQQHPQTEVTGMDGDPQILAMAARKARKANVAVRFEHAFATCLPFPDCSFDRVVSSLFFHHLSPRDKLLTARELLRVLTPAGELHFADWGRPTGLIMRGAFLGIQLLDGFQNTRDHVDGRLLDIFTEAGFEYVAELGTLPTMFGTMSLSRATAGVVLPGRGGQADGVEARWRKPRKGD